MKLITTKEQILTNLKTLEQYIKDGTPDEAIDAQKLVGKGKCLIAYKSRKEWRFAPSRFVGYINNSLRKHSNNNEKDGRDTNPAIQKSLRKRFTSDIELEEEYLNYCGKIGATASAYKKRKYLRLT